MTLIRRRRSGREARGERKEEREKEEKKEEGMGEGKGKGGRRREEVLYCVWFSQVVIS